MVSFRLVGLAAASLLVAFGVLAPATARNPVKARVSFQSQVKPIFASKCIGCHSKSSPGGGLALDSTAGIKKGGDSGKLYVAGKSSQSLITKRLKGEGGERMPYGGAALPAAQINLVKKWIDEGAKF
ncbi:MAG: hypothetical protein JSS66_04010 [Armatimonadetes bacterium]|nr:hypothetical protein [Armatimonadota bacterium]